MASPSPSRHTEWPTNPLDCARDAFAWLTAGPHPVALDGRLFDHLPDREIPVDELRDLLLQHGCPRRVWDQVWTHVIVRARVEGGTWTVVAVGLALPMLIPMAARLTDRYADDPADICAEVLRGFLDALTTVDLDAGRIAIRLRWAAYRAGHRALIAAMATPAPAALGSGSSQTPAPSGHPDLVLARAVQDGVLTQTEAEVISATRLGEHPLNDWAREKQIGSWAAYKARERAETRLAAWLAASPHDHDETDPTGRTATSEPSPSTNPDRSQKVAKKIAEAESNQPPKSGLQGCG